MTDSKDTGTGGINVDGKLYTMDVGVPDQQGGQQGQWSPGGISVDNNVKDISKPTKETFAKYLSKTTLGIVGSSTHPNAYPVGKGDQTTVTEIDLNDPNGVPTKPYETNNESTFASVGIGSPPPDGIKRGYDPTLPNAKDGNQLLPTAASPAPPDENYVKFTSLNEPVKKYTEGVLGKNLYTQDPNDDKAVAEAVGGVNDFFGQKYLQVATQKDLGTFNNLAKGTEQQKVTKVTLQDYMRRQVTGKEGVPGEIPNKFLPPEANSDLFVNDPATGYPVSPKETSANSPSSFEPGLASSYSDAAQTLDSSFNRGKAVNGYPDGNSILKDAAPPAANGEKFVKEQNEPVKGYLSKVLQKNRFTPGRTFVPLAADGKFAKFGDPPFGSDAAGDPRKVFEKNASFAAKTDLKLGESLSPDDDSRNYTFRRLSKVGNVLQLRATGEIIALTENSVDPLDPLTGLAALAPGAGQGGAGVPLPIEQLNIENIIRDLADPQNDSEDSSRFNGTLLNFSSKFEGVINSSFEKFSSFAPIGMIALVTVMVVVIVTVITGLGALLGLAGNPIRNRPGFKKGQPKKDEVSGRLGMGAFNGSSNYESANDIISMFLPTNGDSSQILRFFGIMPTHKPPAEAVRVGALNFFGVDQNYNPVKTFQSPGYFVTMARAIVRSVSEIVLACEEFGKLLATGNITSGIEQIFELLGRIKNSRFVSTINIFGQIGDANFRAEEYLTVKDLDNGDYFSVGAIESSARQSNDLPALYGQGRMNAINSTKLGWANDRAPSLLSLPMKAWSLSYDLGDKNYLYDRLTYEKSRATFASPLNPEGRIDTLLREKIEEKFDAEYVPFYFHDLRTNEILGFHAFLTNLGDSYTANYESTEGFGRIDPVKTYKNTTRRIDVGFVIAATGPDDLKVMWDKINKLTTLVYPQMTQGKRLGVSTANGDFIFTKPFTQQIGAAPMVRLRLGDLFASNYSKFNIAGIFGATDDTTQMGSQKLDDAGFNQTAAAKVIKNKKIAADPRTRYQPGDTVILKKTRPYYFESNPTQTSTYIVPYVDYKSYMLFEITNIGLNEKLIPSYSGRIIERPADELDEKQKNNLKVLKDKIATKSAVSFQDADMQIPDVFNPEYQFTVNFEDIEGPSQKTKKRLEEVYNSLDATPQEIAAAPGFIQSLEDFLNPDKNAIVRSFRSAGGKGLAGFIDSLALDWNTGTWTADSESPPEFVVPKVCKVTISFTPIHDISPGLSHNGFNRAPIYPVGTMTAKTAGGQNNNGSSGGG